MSVTQQVEANTEAIQAIADEATDINSLLPKAIPAELTDNFAIQDANGNTIKLSLSQVADLIASQNATTVNYASLKPPQLFNPDGTDVSNGFADFTLSASNQIGFVSINGQVIDDSEYSLLAGVITVTPDNGFFDTADEVLVFQFAFATDAVGVKYNFTSQSANYLMAEDDYYVECIANTFDVTLPNPAAVGAGSTYNVKNSGNGTITLISLGTIEGEVGAELLPSDSLTLTSNGTNYLIV